MVGLSGLLNSSLQKLGGEEGHESQKEGENVSFNLNGTSQIFGWVLMAIGVLLLAGGLNQGILHSDQAEEETPRLTF